MKKYGGYAFFALVFLSLAAAFAFADAFFAAAAALVIFTDVVITSFSLIVVYATNVTLFMPGYTLSYNTGIRAVLRGDFRDREAENAPGGSGGPPGSLLFRHQKAEQVPFGIEDHRGVPDAGDGGLGHQDCAAKTRHLCKHGVDILHVHEIQDRFGQLPLVQPTGVQGVQPQPARW